jgi:hypothetical protein
MQHIKVVEETSDGNFALTTAFLATLDALVNSISMVSRRKACCSIHSIVRGSREIKEKKQNVILCLLSGYYNIKSDPRKFDKQMHPDTAQQVEGEKLTDWNPD